MLPTTISDIATTTTGDALTTNGTIVVTSPTVTIMDIESWDEDRVFNWALKNRQGTYYADILRINHIDGRALLNLTEKDISLMGISIGPAKNLLADIQSIKFNRNINWAYEKVYNFNEFVQLYFPYQKLREIGTDGFIKVKDYSVASYSFIKDNIGNYIPYLNKNNNILPDRNPLLSQQQPQDIPSSSLSSSSSVASSSSEPIQLFNSNYFNQQQQQQQQQQYTQEQFEKEQIRQFQHQILNETPNYQTPVFDQQIVGQSSDDSIKNESN